MLALHHVMNAIAKRNVSFASRHGSLLLQGQLERWVIGSKLHVECCFNCMFPRVSEVCSSLVVAELTGK